MKKDLTFVAVDGKLTMSSAAHLRDLAALSAREILSKMNNIHFTNKYVQLIASKEQNQTQIGCTDEGCRLIPDAIHTVIQLQSFEAWMNEAIQAKRNLFDELKSMTVQEYIKNILNEEVPVSPTLPHVMTEDEYLAELNIKERNRYFELQTTVAAIGKLIHKDSPYDRAINELQDALVNPIKEILNGRDTILHVSRKSLDENVVNEVFYKLQKEHREAQAALNGMKDQMDKAIKKSNIEATEAHMVAYEEYQAKMQKYSISLSQYKQQATADLEKLKIVIPQHLEGIYQELSNLGK